MADRHQRVKELFLRARELPPEEREKWLDEACGGDVSVREDVASLLAVDDDIASDYLAPEAGAGFPLAGRLGEGLLRALDRSTTSLLGRRTRQRVGTGHRVHDAVADFHSDLRKMEPRRRHALAAYLRQSIQRRAREHVRHVDRLKASAPTLSDQPDQQHSMTEDLPHGRDEIRYRNALARVSEPERDIIVGRIELDFSYEQLALATGRASPGAARIASRKALLHLADEMQRG